MQTIKPANQQLFCKKQEAVTQTKSGFLLTEKNAEKPQLADVINVGDDVKSFKSKDVVVYKPYATVDVKLEGEEYFLIHQDDVLGSVVNVKEA